MAMNESVLPHARDPLETTHYQKTEMGSWVLEPSPSRYEINASQPISWLGQIPDLIINSEATNA